MTTLSSDCGAFDVSDGVAFKYGAVTLCAPTFVALLPVKGVGTDSALSAMVATAKYSLALAVCGTTLVDATIDVASEGESVSAFSEIVDRCGRAELPAEASAAPRASF